MQKTTFALVLALTLCCASAYYTVDSDGWVKAPQKIIDNTADNITSRVNFALSGLSDGDVTLIAYQEPVNATTNESSSTWSVFTKAIDVKALTSSSNMSYNFTADKHATLAQGYAICVEAAVDSNNIPQIYMYQTKITTALVLPRVVVTSNTASTTTIELIDYKINIKNVFIIFRVGGTMINTTSVALGGSEIGKMFNVSTNANTTSTVSITYGDALKNYQYIAGWNEGDSYKVALVDMSDGTTSNQVTIGKYDKNMVCQIYVTDKTHSGVWCTNSTLDENGTIVNTTVYIAVRDNNTDLTPLFTVTGSEYTITEAFPYSGYLGFKHKNATTYNATILSYEIWDLDTKTQFKNKTTYLTYDQQTAYIDYYTIRGGGMFALVYNANASNWSQPSTENMVGLLLGGSYLTSAFGFLLTIIAGLLLF